MISPDAHRRVREVFEAASELDERARPAFLDEACGNDVFLRREVESLLRSLDGTRTEQLFPPLVNAEEAETLAIGERIGPYVLRREIGAGGMGVVYEAAREDVDKTVALKLVRHGRLASPEHIRRFLQERRLLARLEHTNVARMLDAGVTESGLPFLVMEYVDGEPIDRYCDSHRLTVVERLVLFRQVCDAVHYAHRHLVIHRDLKPSNIAVTADGVAKLLDFGIATLLDEDPEAGRRLTRSGLVLLTPEYAAPEQLRGEPVTTASDVYALGTLLFELLSGYLPFGGRHRTTPELLRLVCEVEPLPPSEAVRKSDARGRGTAKGDGPTAESVAAARRTSPTGLVRQLAGDIDTIVIRALNKAPERRYLSAQELREDIDRYLTGRPVHARGDSPWYRARKFVRRHTAVVGASALAVAALAAGVVATAHQARRAEAERTLAEERFRDVRSLAGALVADVHDAISDLPGSTPVRATLVAGAVEHLDRLHRQSGDDPALLRDIAEGYLRLGLVQGNPTIANLGDLSAARRSFERALSIAQGLVAVDPSDHAARRTLALAHEKMGDADAWGGRLSEGLVHARSALEAWSSLATAHPASADMTRSMATSHLKLGDLLGHPNLPNLGDRAGATREYRHALGLLSAMSPDSAKQWPTRRLQALVHERLGALMNAEGQHDDAVAQLGRALEIREALVRERNASVDARRDLAVVHQLLCEAHLEAGSTGRALTGCRQAIVLYEMLRDADPRNAQGIHDFALGRLSLSKVLTARGEIGAALAHLEGNVEPLRRLLAADTGNVAVRRTLGRSLLARSEAHAELASNAPEPSARREHLRLASIARDEGERFLIGEHGRPSREDSALLARLRTTLAGSRTLR
jgi:non-specific serine/threonine protein kinase/serine/threonine-protein kinase